MIAVGEETGRLEAMLESVADTYEATARRGLRNFLTVLAPGVILSADAPPLASAARRVRPGSARARTLAASGSRVRAVSFDVGRGEYAVDGEERKYLLPEGIRIASARVGTGAAVPELFRIRFFPDGSAEGAEIAIPPSAGGRPRVTVGPLTGVGEAGAWRGGGFGG